MAKKSHKRAVRYEKDRSGCMWGLISMFDFRYGRSSRKLLADWKHGSKHSVGIENSNTYEILAGMNEDFHGILDEEEYKKTAIAATPSMKKLIDDEISGEKDVKKEKSKFEAEAKQSDSGYEYDSKTDQNKTTKTRKKCCVMDILDFSVAESLNSECSCNQHSEPQSVNNLSIGKIMEELCQQIHQKSTSCLKHDQDGKAHIQSINDFSVFEDRFAKAIKEFTGQKFNYGKDITEDQKMQHSRELLDALKFSRSREELFLNLIQNPSSLLGKYVQDFQDAQMEEVEQSESTEFSKAKELEEVADYKQHNFFERKAKLRDGNVPNENERSEVSNRIVILKPGPTGLGNFVVGNKVPNERIGSHFFLTEIKRKLKNALGKERHGISTKGSSNRAPLVQNMGNDERVVKENVGRNFQINDHFPIGRISRPSSMVRVEKTEKMKESEPCTEYETDNYCKKGISNIYIEAKKHLSEILSSGDEGVEFLTGQKPKTLGRVISLPGYNYSPLASPRSSAYGEPLNVNENTQSPARENTNSHIGSEKSWYFPDGVPAQHKNPNILEGIIDENKMEETICPEGDVETSEVTETATHIEGSVTDASSDLNLSSITIENQYGDVSDACDDQGHSECFKKESHEETEEIHFTPLSSPLASPSGSSVIVKVGEYLESVSVSPERPSPISVLEPLFSEDDVSPDSTVSLLVGLPVQPLQIQFEEQDHSSTDDVHSSKICMEDKQLIFDHVKRVLLASGLNWNEFCVEWLSSEELLDRSLVDEVDLFSNGLCCDQKLVFDCINEVLPDICQQFSPWLLFVKSSVRPAPDLIGEEVYWHLLPLPRPRTLDQIVLKDMERKRTWLDLCLETEIIGIDTTETILKELMEEIILNCAWESPRAEFE